MSVDHLFEKMTTFLLVVSLICCVSCVLTSPVNGTDGSLSSKSYPTTPPELIKIFEQPVRDNETVTSNHATNPLASEKIDQVLSEGGGTIPILGGGLAPTLTQDASNVHGLTENSGHLADGNDTVEHSQKLPVEIQPEIPSQKSNVVRKNGVENPPFPDTVANGSDSIFPLLGNLSDPATGIELSSVTPMKTDHSNEGANQTQSKSEDRTSGININVGNKTEPTLILVPSNASDTSTGSYAKIHKPKSKPLTTTSDKDDDDRKFPSSPTKTPPLGMPRKIDYIVPIVITIMAVPMLGVGMFLLYRRGRDCWEKRHYKRMDFLIDGMYND